MECGGDYCRRFVAGFDAAGHGGGRGSRSRAEGVRKVDVDD